MFCWELGPLHSTFVALPPPARASTRNQTAPQQAAAGLMSCAQQALPSAKPFRFRRDLKGSLFTMKCAMFGTYCPA